MNQDDMFAQKELLDMYSDIIEGDSYLIAADCKGAAPVCRKYVNGECIQWDMCN